MLKRLRSFVNSHIHYELGNPFEGPKPIMALFDGDIDIKEPKPIMALFDGDIDMMLEEAEQEVAERYVERPTDADGVPIHVGDSLVKLIDGKETEIIVNVHGVGEGTVLFVYEDEEEEGMYGLVHYECESRMFRHYSPPTVEDVLVEYHKECQLHSSELGFCDDESKEKAWREIASEFAKRLQLRESD